MAYPGVFYSDDGQILRAMQKASDNGAMIMMHAENGIAIDVLVAQALARGETDPKYHGITRRSELEGEATNRAIVLAKRGRQRARSTSCTCRPARRWRRVAAARDQRRQRVRRDLPAVPLPDARGPPGRSPASRAPSTSARRRCAPSTRTTRPTCGRACAPTTSSCVSTDHCPFCFKEQKELGLGDFSKIPNGIGGVEHRDGPDLPGRRRRRAQPDPLGRDVRHHAGPDVRPVPAEGRHRARLATPTSWSTTPTAAPTHRRRDRTT